MEQRIEKKDSTFKSWLIVFVVLFSGICLMLNQYKVPTMIGAFMQDFKMFGQLGKINWLMSVFAIAGIVLALPTASLLIRFGPKVMGLVGLACSLIGITIGATSYSYIQLLIGRIVEGAGVAMMGVVATTLISMYFPREKAGAPMGIWNIWYPTGSALGYSLAFPVLNAFERGAQGGANFGWHAWWFFGDFLVLIAFILFALLVSKPKVTRESSGEHPKARLDRNVFRDGVSVGRMWVLGLASGCLLFAALSFLTQVPHYLSSTHPEVWANDAMAGEMSSIGFVSSIPMSIVSSFLLTKFTSKKSRSIMMIIGAVVSYIYAFAFFIPISSNLEDPQIPLKIFLILDGFASGYVSAVMWANVPITMSRRSTIPVGMAIITICQGVANLTVGPIIGYIVQTGGNTYNWYAASIPIAIAATCGLILSIIYFKTKPAVYEENEGQPIGQAM